MKKKKNRLHDPRLLFYIFLQLNKEKTKQILPELGTFALMTLKKTNETKKKTLKVLNNPTSDFYH